MNDISVSTDQGTIERGLFTGNTKEYFGIWIVNILLTIITLGIYSAWAKVRRKRYFNGNTVLAGRAFGYHATGGQIFKGRLIAFAFIVISQLVTLIHPFLVFAPLILLIIFFPWLITRSIRFNARVTSYRNVRFDFVGTAGGAFVSVMLGGLVALFSLGILAPLSSRWANRYIFSNLRYGDRPFSADPKIVELYDVWIAPAIMVVIGGVICGLIGFSIMTSNTMMIANEETATMMIMAVLNIGLFGAFVVYGLASIVYHAGVRNVVVSSMWLDGKHELYSAIQRRRYLWIVISNLIVTVFTFGLMRPWAAVREARYTVERTAIRFNGDVGEVLSSMEATGAAVSAEYMDMEGFEFGF
ncbi:YjgN family protein [Agrobacterium arsenijevicii]|uniref:Membrane protein n=1 Tax=Agrobacterium arsenijevicii TaxID=1585697 RepID=A0ABR5DEB4_9HYPH|nr:membrane protein [Agrobacterium arsenijevicii]